MVHGLSGHQPVSTLFPTLPVDTSLWTKPLWVMNHAGTQTWEDPGTRDSDSDGKSQRAGQIFPIVTASHSGTALHSSRASKVDQISSLLAFLESLLLWQLSRLPKQQLQSRQMGMAQASRRLGCSLCPWEASGHFCRCHHPVSCHSSVLFVLTYIASRLESIRNIWQNVFWKAHFRAGMELSGSTHKAWLHPQHLPFPISGTHPVLGWGSEIWLLILWIFFYCGKIHIL